MKKNDAFTKIMAVSGTLLVILPLATLVIFALIRFFSTRRFILDYLINLETFHWTLLGSGLLIWAAFRAKSRLKLISWSFGAIVALMVLGLALAVFSGMTPLGYSRGIDDIWFKIVLGFLAAPYLAQVVTVVGGFLLVRDLLLKH